MQAVLRRELRRIARRAVASLLLLVLPALALALTLAIFGAGIPRELPVAVVDLDHSRLSRQLTRMVDAAPSVRVSALPADPGAAVELVLRAQAYAYVVIPEHFERDLRRGASAPVLLYANAQRLVPASLVRRDVLAATSTLSAGVELRRLRAAGETAASAVARFEPVRAEVHALFNPELHYGSYLVLALFPTLLHVFVLLAGVDAVGSELREGTSGEWLAAAGGSLPKALAGKLLPGAVCLLGVAAVGYGVLFAEVGVPQRGSWSLLVLGTLLLVAAYQALAVLLVAITANLRFATSLAAFFASPAFAYAGITFPTMGMPFFARAWGSLLPLTHYLRLLFAVSAKAAPLADVAGPLAALAGFTLLLGAAGSWRLRRVAREPRFWGRS